MGISLDEMSLDVGYQSNVPVFLSLYMLNACKKGKLFSLDTYRTDNLSYWIKDFLSGVMKNISFPSHFEETTVQKIFIDKTISKLKESELIKMFEAIDVDDIDSVKKLVEENRERGKEGLIKLEKFLKQDEFPPFLWMEFARFARVFIETSEFLEKIMYRLFKFKPSRLSQIHQKSRLTQAMLSSYISLIDHYFKTTLAYTKLFVFIEVWSCEKDSELFTEKCVWTFRNIKQELFEPVFLEFHDSIGQLRQSFFKFTPQEAQINFSKPTEWAFKQLIQMT